MGVPLRSHLLFHPSGRTGTPKGAGFRFFEMMIFDASKGRPHYNDVTHSDIAQHKKGKS